MGCTKTHFLNLLAVMFVLPTLALAADDCSDLPNGPARILACTRQINSGKKAGENQTDNYANRGRAYADAGDYDRAIADYSEAIRLEPKNAFAYNGRGFAYSEKGEYDRSIADCDEAIWLDPKRASAYRARGHAYSWKGDNDSAVIDYDDAIQFDPDNKDAYFRRGLVHFFNGSILKAAADLNRSNELNPSDAYSAIWLDLAERRNNQPDHLEQTAAQLDRIAWPAPVVRFLLGQSTSQQLFAAADSKDAKTRQGQICEANFYDAELSLLKGSKDDAARLFRLAVTLCPHPFVEWAGANAELKALGVRP